jgi:hypothetical protein
MPGILGGIASIISTASIKLTEYYDNGKLNFPGIAKHPDRTN